MKKITLLLFVSLLAWMAFIPSADFLTIDPHPMIERFQKWLNRVSDTRQEEKLYVQLDRSLYEAGSTVWFTAFLRNAYDLSPAETSGVIYIDFLTANGKLKERQTHDAPQGVATGRFMLPNDLPGGVYTLKAYTQWMKNDSSAFTKTFQVQQAVIPRLSMKMDFVRKGYSPGETAEAMLRVKTVEDQPLRYIKVQATLLSQGKSLKDWHLQLDYDGKALVQLPLPDTVLTDALLQIQIPYLGQKEMIARPVPLASQQLKLDFLPEGGHLIAGLPNRVAFKAVDRFGKPIDVAGEILDDSGQVLGTFSSYYHGMGIVEITPRPGAQLRARLTQPAGIEKRVEWPTVASSGVLLQVVEQTKEQLRVILTASEPVRGHLLLQKGDEVRFAKTLQPFSKKQVSIPTKDIGIGIARLTWLNEAGAPQSERLVFLNRHQQLDVEIETDKAQYLERDKVQTTIRVRDHLGNPVQGQFALSVTDEKQLSMTDDRQGHILSSLLLEQELRGEIEDPNFYFDPDPSFRPDINRDRAIDLLMLTQGWRRFDYTKMGQESDFIASFPKERAVFAGQVVDGHLQPLAGAHLHFSHLPDQMVTSDAEGCFSFSDIPFPDGKPLQLEVSKEGYGSATKYLTAFSDQLQIPLSRGRGAIVGKIDPKPSNSFVQIANSQNQWNIPVDPQGGFALHHLPEGLYQLSCTLPNGQAHHLDSVQVVKNQQTILKLVVLDEQEKQVVRVESRSAPLPANRILARKWEVDKPKGPPGPPNVIEEVIVTEYAVPLIEQDNTTAGQLVAAEQIRNLPVRNVQALAANTAGLKQQKRAIHIQGSRNKDHQFFVDGVRVGNADLLMDEVVVKEFAVPPMPRAFSMAEDEEQADIAERLRPGDRMNEGVPKPLEVPSYRWVEPYYTRPQEVTHVPDQFPRFLGCRSCNKIKDPEKRQSCSDEAAKQYLESVFATSKNGLAQLEEYVQFTVNEDGLAGDFQLIQHSGAQSRSNWYLRQRFQQLQQKMAYWQPARKDGKAVSARYSMPIDIPDINRTLKVAYTPEIRFYTPVQSAGYSKQLRQAESPTLFWQGLIELDSVGEAQVQFRTGYELTSYQMTVEGLGRAHQIGRAKHTFSVKPAVSAVVKFPSFLRDGDQLKLPITLLNNSQHSVSGNLQLLDQQRRVLVSIPSVEIVAGEEQVVTLDYTVRLSEQELKIGEQFFFLEMQHVEHPIFESFPVQLAAKGYPEEQLLTGIETTNIFEVDLTQAIAGTLEASFQAHPSWLSELISTLERMIRQPSGCFEQTSSSNYPNILALQLLRESGQSQNQIEQRAQNYLKSGYSRLISYEVEGGGFDWFGKGPAHEALTAYGLMQFVDMQEVYPVDQDLIDRTGSWLLGRRDGQGGWTAGKKGLHSWKGDSNIRNAYIVWALSEAGFGSQIRVETDVIYKQVQENDDPYVLALVANALLQQKDERAEKLLIRLRDLQQSQGYWSGTSCSVVNSKGRNLHIETTALAILALQQQAASTSSQEAIQKGLLWLKAQKGNRGYGSTQSTVLALKAILGSMKDGGDQGNKAGQLALLVNGKLLQRFNFTPGRYTKISHRLTRELVAGEKNQIEVVFEKGSPIPFEVDLHYSTKMKASAEHASIAMTTHFAKAKVSQGQSLRLSTTLTNPTKDIQTNPIAVIGLPAGLQPQAWQLRELMDKGIIDYYEIKGEELVFYLLALAPKESRQVDLDLEAVAPGTYYSGAGHAYLYYENDAVVWSPPLQVVVD